MPYKDSERNRLAARNSHRKATHGTDWRGIYWHYGLTCANTFNIRGYPDCLGDEGVEFHAPWGEGKGQDINLLFPERVPLCILCHIEAHPNMPFPVGRGRESRLTEDVYTEMEYDGGYLKWLKRRDVGHSLMVEDRP